MKYWFAPLLLLLSCLAGKSQQLYYLSDIPANPNFGVALQDSHLYVIKNFGVSSFNISQPTSPAFIASVTPQHWPLTLYADGSYLYCGGGMVGQFAVLDISQPSTISIVHQDPSVTGTVYQFTKSAQHLYFTSSNDTLFIADITNPSTPIIVSRTPINQTFTEGSALAGNRLFLGSAGGLLVYDISNPSQPFYLNNYPGSFRKLSYNQQAQQLYVLSQNGDIAVYNAANPNALTFQYNISADASSFTANNSRIAVITNPGGVALMEAGSTGAVVLSTYTTPFPGGQHNSIAMQDSIIAYTTVNSTYLLKYGFINPQGVLENSERLNALMRYSLSDHTIRCDLPEELKRQLIYIRCFDAGGRLIIQSDHPERSILPAGTLPVAYLLELTNGQFIHGRFTMTK